MNSKKSKAQEQAQHSPDMQAFMTADGFYAWRKKLGLKQKEAAELLGLQKRMIQYYEKGSRNGKPVIIPKSVRLACYALERGIEDYDGKNAQTFDLDQFGD